MPPTLSGLEEEVKFLSVALFLSVLTYNPV